MVFITPEEGEAFIRVSIANLWHKILGGGGLIRGGRLLKNSGFRGGGELIRGGRFLEGGRLLEEIRYLLIGTFIFLIVFKVPI